MTSKASSKRVIGQASPTVSTSSAQLIPAVQQISLESHILASRIILPTNFSIVFAQLTPLQSSQSHQEIDHARRAIFESNSGRAVEESLLSHSQISSDVSTLWVFAIESDNSRKDGDAAFLSRLEALNIQGLTKTGMDRFFYHDLYPCCFVCSMQRNPCPTCLQPSSVTSLPISFPSSQSRIPSDGPQSASREPTPAFSPAPSHSLSKARLSTACHLPRRPLRQPYTFFLSAVQNRVINDMCERAMRSGRVARRLRGGVLWGLSSSTNNWGDGWDQHGKTRPLSFCQIEVTLFPSGLLVQPRFHPTHFLPFLPSSLQLPGTPINLLPFSTPAYYLNMYSGPTSTLVKQFQASLIGLGAGDLSSPSGSMRNLTESGTSTQFVIAWVSVQNKQGEEKGMMVIWPAALCLSLLSAPESDKPGNNILFACNRKPLSYIPELPIALQASPVPVPATVPMQQRAVSPHDSLFSPLFTPGAPMSASREASPGAPFQTHLANLVKANRPSLSKAARSFSLEATQAFRSLTVSHLPPRDIRKVTAGVGKYVDFVAKERERERERIKKEREAAVLGQGAKMTDSSFVSEAELSGLDSGVSSSAHSVAEHIFMTEMQPTTQTLPSITVNTHPLIVPSSIQTPHPLAPPVQPAYPSPPDDLVKPDEDMSDLEVFASQIGMDGIEQVSAAPTEAFEPFANMDEFMMDLGMDFSLNIPPSTVHQGGLSSENIKLDLDSLGVFTDDDFSFFDDPVRTTSATGVPRVDQIAIQPPCALSSEEALSSLGISPLFGDSFFTSIPGTSGTALTSSVASSWPHTKLTDGFDVKPYSVAMPDGASAPELITSSPDRLSSSPPGPITPDVTWTSDFEAYRPDLNQPFYPITFSNNYHSSDKKYAIGKFSSSLIEKDIVEHESPFSLYWRTKYTSVTDPRVAVVKKLAGVKRKIDIQGVRTVAQSPAWNSTTDDEVSVVDDMSEQDSDDQCMDDEDDLAITRPSTPLPAHIPLGPTLISTQFSHSLLLPLSINLRPAGAAFTETDIPSPIPNPVPTPVSPAAVLGQASEKSKSLEATVQILGREVVENSVWASAWRSSAVDQAPPWKQVDEIEQTDSSFDGNNFLSACWLWDTMTIGSISDFASPRPLSVDCRAKEDSLSMLPLEHPLFAVGKTGGIIHLSPPALRFWAKLGLTPRSGPKDVVAFAMFQDDEGTLNQAGEWLSRVSAIYTSKGYGSHKLGKICACPKDGLIPIQFTSFRKSLASALNSIELTASTLLFYVVTPGSVLSLSSPLLRQIFSGMKRALVGHEKKAIYFHFVPEFLFSSDDDVATASSLETLVDGVYDRIRRSVDRFMSRPFFAYGEETRKLFEAPSFTLARAPHVATSLSFHHPQSDLGSLDRHTILHVGYKLSKCGKWLVAACIDQRGESHDLALWLIQDDTDHKQAISLVWKFAKEFARGANVEWRIVFAKLGVIDETELEAWDTLLSDECLSDEQDIAMHISITSIEGNAGWTILEQKSNNLTKSHNAHDIHGKDQIFSTTIAAYTLSTFLRCPLPSKWDADLGAHHNHIPDDDDSIPSNGDRLRPLHTAVSVTTPSDPGHASANAQYIHLLQTARFACSTLTKTDEETFRDICRNYHELAVLTRARWQLHVDPALPYHLAALQVVESTLELSDAVLLD